MALYAFDGTWNVDEENPDADTNVVRFKELYSGPHVEYIEGVGTRLGALGRIVGGAFGVGGRSRVHDMYEALTDNWVNHDDKVIDIVGFSRGAALAVHFANKIAEEGIRLPDGSKAQATIRFLGLWDIVGSFGIALDTIVDFQKINLGWNIDTVASSVQHCFHAMALDERRETFNVTRLDPENRLANVQEVWFRGVHGDVGGGNDNTVRSNIALNWMVARARESGLAFDEAKARDDKYAKEDAAAPVSENLDPKRDQRRKVGADDEFHPSAKPKRLEVGESHSFKVLARLKYNWSGVKLIQGETYEFQIAEGDTWLDKKIECGPTGWTSDQLPWFKEPIVAGFEKNRRLPEANWFELIGALGDEDDVLFRIKNGGPENRYVAEIEADLYAFANDLQSKYDNNSGWLDVTVTRIS